MQAFQLDGYWYPSDSQYDNVPGTLEFDPKDGLTLTLMGRFKSHTKIPSGREYRMDIDTIFGETSIGGYVTLSECSVGKFKVPSEYEYEGRGVTHYHPEYCFAGEHTEAGPQFNSITLQLTNLDRWVHSTDIDDIEVELDDGSEIVFSYANPVHKPTLGNTSEEDYKVTFRFDSPRRFESIKSDIIKPLQFLITFGLQEPVFPLNIYGVTESMGNPPFANQFPGAREIDAFSRVGTSVVYPESRLRLKKEGRTHPQWTLAHIEDDIESILFNWYKIYHCYQPLFDIFFTSMYYDDLEYPSVTVLNLTRCLESYHRKADKYDNRYIAQDEFEEYRDTLIDTIPSSFPDSFTDHLENGTFRYANRVSLRKRLKDIIRDQELILEERLREDLNSDEMAAEIKNVRNDLTHLSDEDVSEFEVEGEILYKLCRVIETVIADEVGFDPKIFPFYSQ